MQPVGYAVITLFGKLLHVRGLDRLQQALGVRLPPTMFWRFGVHPSGPRKMAPVALAMKSMSRSAAATSEPAASVSFVTEPSATAGMARSAGPQGSSRSP